MNALVDRLLISSRGPAAAEGAAAIALHGVEALKAATVAAVTLHNRLTLQALRTPLADLLDGQREISLKSAWLDGARVRCSYWPSVSEDDPEPALDSVWLAGVDLTPSLNEVAIKALQRELENAVEAEEREERDEADVDRYIASLEQ